VPSVKFSKQRPSWQSPVSVDVLESAGAVRAALEELGWAFERRKSVRLYSKFAVAVMMPKGAYVFQFLVAGEPSTTIETWETELSPGARIAHLKVEGETAGAPGTLKGFLDLYRTAAGKDPWRFSAGERSRAGFLLPEFSRAKKAWAAAGFDVKAKKR
jgi:hypothetical protein